MTVNDLHPPFDGKDKSGDRASLKKRPPVQKEGKQKRNRRKSIPFPGADSQIRTGDLILTKDALYLLSYISKHYAPLFKGHSGDREGT